MDPTTPDPATPAPAELGRLTPAQLIDRLVAQEDAVPRVWIDECARRADAMVDALWRLTDDKRFWRDDVAPGRWWMRLHAIMILGLIPSERAGLLLVRLMRRVAAVDDDDLQDWIAGYWPALFANKAPATIQAVRDLALDRSVGCYMRSGALEVVTSSALRQGSDSLERTLDWLSGIAQDGRQDWDVRMHVGSVLLDFPRARHRPLLEDLAARQEWPVLAFSKEEVEAAFVAGKDTPEWERFADPWEFYTPEAQEERRLRWVEDAIEADDEPDPEPHDDPDSDIFGKDAPGWDVPAAPAHAAPKVGRNDPCPCGSGKKYKHCHMHAQEDLAPGELAWRRVRRAIEGLPPQVLETALERFGPEALEEAWRAFNPGSADEHFEFESPHAHAFLSWFCHHWLPDPESTRVPMAARDLTGSQVFQAKRGKRLDAVAQRYLQACAVAPFSFFEVQSCEPGRGFRLLDVLLDESRYVFEASASALARRGDLLYGSVVVVDEVALIEACGPVRFPPVDKPQIIALRARLAAAGGRLDIARLRMHQAPVRDLYLDLTARQLDPQLPQLQNTDGEPIELHTLNYDIASAREAFDALKDLAGDSDEDLLREAQFDETGALSRVEFRWVKDGNALHANWGVTSLAMLRIDGTRLTAEVNSAARAQRLKSLIAERMGERARPLPSVIQSMESLMQRQRTPAEEEKDRQREAEHEQLTAQPEVQAALAEMTRAHYRAWVDERIPALGNQTPRNAVKSRDGREAVEALILQIERDGPRMQPPLDPAVIAELRATLGLAAPDL